MGSVCIPPSLDSGHHLHHLPNSCNNNNRASMGSSTGEIRGKGVAEMRDRGRPSVAPVTLEHARCVVQRPSGAASKVCAPVMSG